MGAGSAGGEGLLKGQTLGVDATTLEANAALRTIVRCDTGEGYLEFLQRLARESGIKTPTREQLARLIGGERTTDRMRIGSSRTIPMRASPR